MLDEATGSTDTSDSRGRTGGGSGGAPGGVPGPGQKPSTTLTRIGFVVALVLVAALLSTAARTLPPVEGRIGQRVELVALIEAEQARNEELAAKVEQLVAQVAALERDAGSGTGDISALQASVDALALPAGMTELLGTGLVVTLTDSSAAPPAGANLNDYVIHEEDLQAVINALWAGGAEAMAVNGQRILTTTAIRCVGNVLLLHGTTHSPPYVIEAVGDAEAMTAALEGDTAVERFARAVKQHKLGFEVVGGEVLVPAYEGGTQVNVARPAAQG